MLLVLMSKLWNSTIAGLFRSLSMASFEFLGIFLVFFGSVRVLYYCFTFLGAVTITGNDFTTVPEVLLSFFMVGMFLLYFIDFDIFLDDKRVFRNIVMDFLIFLCLYVLETVLITGMQNSDAIIVKEVGNKISMPNNFGTITCYFIMMVTLFYTPQANQNRERDDLLPASHHHPCIHHHHQHPHLPFRQYVMGVEPP